MKFCTYCGSQLSETSRFCMNCGKPVAAPTSADLRPAPAQPESAATAQVSAPAAQYSSSYPEAAQQEVRYVPHHGASEPPAEKSNSKLGIWCFICGFLCWPVGAVLGVLDLVKNRRQCKHGLTIAGLILSFLGLLCTIFGTFYLVPKLKTLMTDPYPYVLDGPGSEAPPVKAETPAPTVPAAPENQAAETGALPSADPVQNETDPANSSETEPGAPLLTADAEYTMFTDYWNSLVLVVTNPMTEALQIRANVNFYDEDGILLGSDYGLTSICAPGDSYVISCGIGSPFTDYSYTLSTETNEYLISAPDDLLIDYVTLDDRVIVTGSNVGDAALDNADVTVLYYQGDRLVDWQSTYFCDLDYELKPGKSRTVQLLSYCDFDSVRIFPSSSRTLYYTPPQCSVDADAVAQEILNSSEVIMEENDYYPEIHFVVQNPTSVQLKVAVACKLFDRDGQITECYYEYFEPLGPEDTTFISVCVCDEESVDYEYSVEVSESGYKSLTADMSLSYSEDDSGVTFYATNISDETIDSATVRVLFYREDKCVYSDICYFNDEDYELKAGETVESRIPMYMAFDYFTYYWHGYNW